jgi:23S rRNA maturation-related 3'-5' exoribonuclease YhaM
MPPIYHPIEALILMIDEPWHTPCLKILEDHRARFEKARGSTHNHQTWDGGYIDHITDGMNFIVYFYVFMLSFCRTLPFTLSDALLVFFLHDLEKPWRIVVDDATGEVSNKTGLSTKEQFKSFRENMLAGCDIKLTPEQQNAFTYIEGEGKDYDSKRRVMNELGAFCHMVDTWCARGWFDYPKAEGDRWTGASRVRTM